MKAPKVKDVVAWIISICEGQENEKEIAAEKLEALPIGYFEDHNIPRTKIKHCINSLPDVLMNTKSKELKEWCAQLIGEFNILNDKSVKALHYAMNDEMDKIIITTVWALGEIGAKGNETENLLVQKSDHPNKDVRWRVAWAFSRIEYYMTDTIIALTKMLSDSEGTTRGYAIIALDKIPVINHDVLVEISKLINDPDPFPRETAKKIIQKYKNPQA